MTSETWTSSDIIKLTKEESFKQEYKTLEVNAQNVDLPLYNNNGDDFTYQVEEIKVPDEFQSTVTQNGNNFTIKNTFIGTTTDPPNNHRTSNDHGTPNDRVLNYNRIFIRDNKLNFK